MRCEVAREALSARLDGESQQVPAQRVDAHLGSCRNCRAWLIGVAVQTRRLASVEVNHGPDLVEKILASAGVAPFPPYRRWLRGLAVGYRRWALIAAGMVQIAVALAQIGGVDFGMVSTSGHGATTGAHLLHESTAWLLALGAAMVLAGIWTTAAVGVAAIAGAFAAVLVGYVAVDAWNGQVTPARMASHLPVLAGLVFALLVAGQRTGAKRPRTTETEASDVALTAAAPGGRRRGHLWPINRSAA
jgi:RNA polymerase sigma-70 factor (ECF subfamily)